jgi:hypothetical protein
MKKKLIGGVLICFLLVLMAGTGLASKQVTLTGTVNEDNQLVTDEGKIYDIDSTDEGLKLLENVGKKVRVVCTIGPLDEDDYRNIKVESFESINE